MTTMIIFIIAFSVALIERTAKCKNILYCVT